MTPKMFTLTININTLIQIEIERDKTVIIPILGLSNPHLSFVDLEIKYCNFEHHVSSFTNLELNDERIIPCTLSSSSLHATISCCM